jgi:bifunctional non-homologous end joining protein LigD
LQPNRNRPQRRERHSRTAVVPDLATPDEHAVVVSVVEVNAEERVGHVAMSPDPANVAAKVKSGPTEWRRRIDESRRRREPCLSSAAERPPSGAGWFHEIKLDGFRLMARRDAAGVRLLTRNGMDWSARYPGSALIQVARQLIVR